MGRKNLPGQRKPGVGRRRLQGGKRSHQRNYDDEEWKGRLDRENHCHSRRQIPYGDCQWYGCERETVPLQSRLRQSVTGSITLNAATIRETTSADFTSSGYSSSCVTPRQTGYVIRAIEVP